MPRVNSRTDRRSMLKLTASALAAAAVGDIRPVSAAQATSAEMVLTGGKILTMDDTNPRAEALAVRGGRIQAIGSDEQIKQYVSGNTKVVELAGKHVTPGLIDGHSHVIGFGQMQLKYVLLRPPKVNSFDTLNNALAKAAQETPAGEWIVGRGFTEFSEGRFPRRWELDDAAPNHPVLIIHWGGQFGVANSMALRQANLLRKDVKNPYGGMYLRDRLTGLPDGVLIHYPAIYSVHQPTLDMDERMECAAWGLEQFARQGVTCVHDNFCHPQYAAAYVRLEQTGKLPCRVRIYPYVKNLEMCKLLVEKIRRYRGPLVRLQGVKLAVDGYALMYDVPAQHRHMAVPMHPQPLFNQIIATIHNADLQADVHAVGDKGVDWTLDAFAKAAGSTAECRRRRHRIEHFLFRKVDTIRRAAELEVPVCIQPNFIEVRAEDMLQKLGASRRQLVETMVPVQTFDREGVRLAYGADVPAFPSHSPMDSIRSAMDRTTARHRRLDTTEAISFSEALHHHTVGGAYAAFDEDEIGSLTPGKQADFVIWKGDLDDIRAGQDAAALAPEATYLAGKPVYQA